MKPSGDAYSRHTPARCGAAGVISLLGGFGGPHPHFGCFDLSREINEDNNETGARQKLTIVLLRPYARLQHDPEKWVPVFRKDHGQSKTWSAMV